MQLLIQQRGVGLIEVLVAVLLLSVAVLGFSALQLRAISATDESLVRTQALSVVRGLAENMRANPLPMKAYEDAINAADPSVSVDPDNTQRKCVSLAKDKTCTAAEIAIKEAEAAAAKLHEYGISMTMDSCPGTANFSEIKCVIAAWGDTLPEMGTNANACANSDGIYNSGSNCLIVEAY